ncbi:MAG: phage minor tail protein L [Rhodobiaceae bacterium]|nr:phage minor tail protein L [Rhodobiaceae bacterium]
MALKEDTLISLFIIDGYRSISNGSFGRINIVSPELTGGQTVTYVNEKGTSVVYNPVPVAFGGVEISASNKLPTPKIRFANVDGGITDLSRDFDDLIGFRLIRMRTYAKFLQKVGTTNGSSPDTNAHFTPDTWYFNRKLEESKLSVSYELASIFDVEGLTLPKRRLYSNFCPFSYRGPECQYSGPNVRTSGQADGCLKTLSACQQHFGQQGLDLRYGGFPTAQNS